LGTERHEARRIDNQLRGRSGRQGDPGETQFFVSMDDQLMRVFASDTVKNMMGRFGIPEDEPIQNGMISRSLESAQTKIEGFHFDARKHVLAYDNVLNQQRQIVYDKRRKLLLGTQEDVQEFLNEVVTHTPEIVEKVEERLSHFGKEQWYEIVRRLMVQVHDVLWVEHLEVMQQTRSSVSLRAYGQQDPLIEYRKEAIRLFKEMQEVALHRIAELIPTLEREETIRKKEQAHIMLMGGATETKVPEVHQGIPVRNEQKIGRNEMVTITNGTETETVKFKKAEERLKSGTWHVVP
jgi:preprotein translocase subunit SecA